MDEILRQLGGLLLGSIPTIILMVLLFAIYNVVVHKPLVKILAERHAKTEGAIEKAREWPLPMRLKGRCLACWTGPCCHALLLNVRHFAEDETEGRRVNH